MNFENERSGKSMDPLLAFWTTSCSIPNTSWTLKGYSRAAFRTGFYIPEIGVMFDAGPQLRAKPDHIFITHCHADHIAELPFTMIEEEKKKEGKIQLYAPRQCEEWLRQYISSFYSANACRQLRSYVETTYNLTSVAPGEELSLSFRKSPYLVEIFRCQHAVPTVCYGLKSVRNKLKEEYLSLSGKEIAELKKTTEITHRVILPLFAFVCDTTIKVFEMNPTLLSYPTIAIECTFLRPEDSNDSEHICWSELKAVTEKYPEKLFILFHFSMRYTVKEIREFFSVENVKNVRLFIENV